MPRATRTFSAAAQTHDCVIGGTQHASVIVSGAFVATLTPQVSRDGGATFDTAAVLTTAGTVVNTITAAGKYYYVGLRPGDIVRVTVAAYTSGAPAIQVDTQ